MQGKEGRGRWEGRKSHTKKQTKIFLNIIRKLSGDLEVDLIRAPKRFIILLKSTIFFRSLRGHQKSVKY